MAGKVETCGDSKAVLSHTLLSLSHPMARAFPKWHTGNGLGLEKKTTSKDCVTMQLLAKVMLQKPLENKNLLRT